MGYKVQFESGQTVEFDAQPTDADIEEAYAQVSKVGSKKPTTQELVSQIPGSEGAPLTEYDHSKDETFLDKYVRGPLETAAQIGTGAISGIAGPVVGLGKAAVKGGGLKAADKYAGEFMQDFTYAPRGTAGQRYGEAVGKVVNEVGIPMAGVSGLPRIGQQYATQPGPSISTTMRDRFNKKSSTPLKSAVAELNAPVEAPKPVEAAVPMTKAESLAKSKEAYVQKLREKELQRKSAFNRPDELGSLEQQSPMERMASELGAEQLPETITPDNSPMSKMAEQLVDETSTPAARAAQDALEARQLELETAVKRQQALEATTNERMRQEAAASVSEAHKAYIDAQNEARIAADSARMGKAEQMLIDDTQHVLPDSGELYASQYGVERGIGRMDENGMPIRADRSMEVQNLENPLQRNLWGDELPRQSSQENVRGITRAMDITPEGPLKNAQREALGAPAKLPPLGSAARKALMKKQGGMLYVGEGKKPQIKKTDKGYEAYVNGKLMGRLESNLTGEQSKMLNESANVDIVKVDPSVKGTGVGSALYDAWSKEHGGNIAPSGKTSKDAWKLWKRNYPEKVESFVQQEAARIRQGAPRDQVLSNVKDADVAQRIVDASRTPFNFKKQGGGVKIDWNDRKKVGALENNPGLKNVLRDVGDSLIESPQEAVRLANQAPDVSQNKVQRAFNSLTKGGTYLKQRVNHPLVHYAVDRFQQANNMARAEISQKLNGVYLNDLRSLSKAEYQEVFELLNTADLNKKELTPEFLAKHGFSSAVSDFITTHQSMMSDVLGKINKAREASDKKPVTAREAYSAMSMSGDYRKVVTKEIDGQKVVVGVIGADRKSGKLGWTLDKIEQHMKKKDPTLEFGPIREPRSYAGSSKGTPHEAFQDALNIIGEDNPHVQEFLNVLREVAKDDPANYMGMQTHTMQKKGVWGMEGRKPWMKEKENATQFFENQVRYIESAYQWSALAEASKEVNTALRDTSVVSKHNNATALVESYMQQALGLNPSKVGQAVDNLFNMIGDGLGVGPSNLKAAVGAGRSTANTWMLSLNPSFLAIQLIQAPAAIPAVTAFLRGRDLAPKHTIVTQGLDYITKGGAALAKGRLNREGLSAIDKGAMDYAEKHHIYASDMVDHGMRTKKDGGYFVGKALHSPAAVIESGTRATTYMAFVKMMDEAGLKPKDGLYEQAHRFTDMAMNNYSSMEKPAIYNALGPIGSMAYNLKSFGHNELSRWSMYAREAANTGNPVPLLTQMTTTIALAGTMGLPFYSQWEELYNYITTKIGSPRSLTLDVIKMSEDLAKEMGPDYENYKNAVSHGLASIAGADISKRVGMGDVIPSNAADAAFAGGGKLADMVKTGAGVIANPDEVHAKAAAVAWAPPVVSSALKSQWYADDNFSYSMDPDKPRKVTAELNGTDRLLKSVGVTGINESVQKTKNYELAQLDKSYQGYREKAMTKMVYDIGQGQPISEEDLSNYFDKGQGDPKTFEQSINSAIMSLNMSPDMLSKLQQSLSNSVTVQRSLQRRLENE